MVAPLAIQVSGMTVEIVQDNARTHKEFPTKPRTPSAGYLGERRRISRSSSAPSRPQHGYQPSISSFSTIKHPETTSTPVVTTTRPGNQSRWNEAPRALDTSPTRNQCRWKSAPNLSISTNDDGGGSSRKIDVAPVLFRRTLDVKSPPQIVDKSGSKHQTRAKRQHPESSQAETKLKSVDVDDFLPAKDESTKMKASGN